MTPADDFGRLITHLRSRHPDRSMDWLLRRTWTNRFLHRLAWAAGSGTFVLTGSCAAELHSGQPVDASHVEVVALRGDVQYMHRLLRTAADVPLGDALRFSVRRTRAVDHPGYLAPAWLITPYWHGRECPAFRFSAWSARSWHRWPADRKVPGVCYPVAGPREQDAFEVLPLYVLLAEYLHLVLSRAADPAAPVSVHRLLELVYLERYRSAVPPYLLAPPLPAASGLPKRLQLGEVLREVAEGRGTPPRAGPLVHLGHDWRYPLGYLAGGNSWGDCERLFREAAGCVYRLEHWRESEGVRTARSRLSTVLSPSATRAAAR